MAKTRTQTKRKARSGSSGRNAKKSKKSPTKADPLVEELIQKAREAGNEDKFVDEVMDDERFTKAVIARAQNKDNVSSKEIGLRSLFQLYHPSSPPSTPKTPKKKAAKKSKKKSSKFTTMETGLVLSFLSTRRQNAPIVAICYGAIYWACLV